MSYNDDGDLNEAFFSQFNSSKTYKKGEVIIHPGENPNDVFYVKEGFVSLYSTTVNGQEIIFNIYKPKAFFPLILAIGDSPNIFYYEAITKVDILKAPKQKLIEYLKKQPERLFELSKRMIIGLDGISQLMQILLFEDARSKVATIFKMLAKRFGEKRRNKIILSIPLTHKLIASLAGLARETTSLEIKKLENSGIISQEKHLFSINKPDELKKYSSYE